METAEQFLFLTIVPGSKTLVPSVEQQKKSHNLCPQNELATERVQSSHMAVELQEQQAVPIQPNLVSKHNLAGTSLEGFIGLSLLLGLSLGCVLYKKYRAYRTAVLLGKLRFWRSFGGQALSANRANYATSTRLESQN